MQNDAYDFILNEEELSSYSDEDRFVLERRFCHSAWKWTLDELEKETGRSRQELRNLEAKAMMKHNHPSNSHKRVVE